MSKSAKDSFKDAVRRLDIEFVKLSLAHQRVSLGLNQLEHDEAQTALMIAALDGSVQIIQLLVEQGRSDPDIQDKVNSINQLLQTCLLNIASCDRY
jgi:hypothetical protein